MIVAGFIIYIYTEKCSLLQFSHMNIFEGCVEVICWWFAGNTWLSSLLHSGHFCHHIERTQWPKGLILWICVLLCFVLKCTWHTSPAHTNSPIWCLKRNTWLQSLLCYDDQVHIKRKTARCQICVWNQQVCVLILMASQITMIAPRLLSWHTWLVVVNTLLSDWL